jgi:hypothetical protein
LKQKEENGRRHGQGSDVRNIPTLANSAEDSRSLDFGRRGDLRSG